MFAKSLRGWRGSRLAGGSAWSASQFLVCWVLVLCFPPLFIYCWRLQRASDTLTYQRFRSKECIPYWATFLIQYRKPARDGDVVHFARCPIVRRTETRCPILPLFLGYVPVPLKYDLPHKGILYVPPLFTIMSAMFVPRARENHSYHHGCCWETFYIFAYCGLVGNPNLTAKI